MAAGLSGDAELARRYFARIKPTRYDQDFVHELGQRAAAAAAIVDDVRVFRDEIGNTVNAARQRLNLPRANPNFWV